MIDLRNCDCMELLATLPDNSVNLIISDPPYFEVKGDFDFIWDSFDDYLSWVEKVVKECKRVLTYNGTVLWYGHAKKIAYSQIILDKYFNLENSLVWEKPDCQAKKGSFEIGRCFTPVTERILMYSNFNQNENDWRNNNATVYYKGFETIRKYIRGEILKVGVNKIAEYLNISNRAVGHWIGKSQWHIPSNDNIDKIKIFGVFLEWEQILKDYEIIRKDYETKHRRFFNNTYKLTDVLKFSQQTSITSKYDHPTQKPEKLTRILIQTCSKENDLVLIPFAGSGVECAMAVLEKRRIVSSEIDTVFFEMALKRIKNVLNQPNLF